VFNAALASSPGEGRARFGKAAGTVVATFLPTLVDETGLGWRASKEGDHKGRPYRIDTA